jgi:alpha-tubulin suppressor-like RCC1 family protein
MSLSNVKAIAAGAAHSLFLLQDGTVMYCGHDGYTSRGYTPVAVNDNNNVLNDIQKIFAGQIAYSTTQTYGNSYCIDSEGNVFGWGNQASSGQLGINNYTNQAYPVKIPGISRIEAVGTNKYYHTSYYTGVTAYAGNAPTGNSSIWTAGGRSYGVVGDGYSSWTTSRYPYLFH